MSKTCPSCSREIENEISFCNFCGAYAGDVKTSEEVEKAVTRKSIIIGAAAFVFIMVVVMLVFVFDIFGLSKKEEAFAGTGNPLFAEGLTPVAISGKWGYANKDGEVVIAPTYEIALPFADKVNGLALVAIKDESFVYPYYGVVYNYINAQGEHKIKDILATPAESFTASGYAKTGNDNFINGAGNDLLEFDSYREYVSDFTNSGYAYVVYDYKHRDREEGEKIPSANSKEYECQNEYVIVDKSGKEKFRFSDVGGDGIADVYEDYFVYFRCNEGHDKEVISSRRFALADYESGKPATAFYDRIFKSNDFYIFCTYDEESCLYKAEIYNKELEKLSDSYYTDNSFKAYDSGLVLYKKSGARFVRVLLNDELKELCEEDAYVSIISGFDKSGIACVKEKDKYAGYNAQGKAFTCEYPFGKMNCGLAPFLNSDGRIGFINANGEIVLGAEYIAVSEFSADGYSTVFCNGSYKIIDTSGKTIIDGLQYPINLIHGNGLDLKWYGNNSFTEGDIKLMFDDDTISVAAGLFGGKKDNVFDRNADYRLYDKNGRLISGKDSIITEYDSERLGGYLEAVIVESTHEFFPDCYSYKLVDKNGNMIKNYTDVRYIGVPDEYGVVCVKKHYSLDDQYRYHLEFNNPAVFNGTWYHTEADNGYYLGIGSDTAANVYDSNLNRVSVFPCNLEAEIDRGKVIFYRDVNYSFDWIPEDAVSPVRCYYVYDFYNGRKIAQLDDAPSGSLSVVHTTFTENGFIYCYYDYNSMENILLSQDGKQLATDCELVSDSYKDIVLLKNRSDGKYYFIDRFGNKSEMYDYATDFGSDGYATVRKSDGKYYCIDIYYNEIFSSDKQFMGFNNGLAAFYDEETGFIGYMDKAGKTVIEPKFHALSDFSYDGYAIAGDDYGRLYIIDKKGDTVIATDGFEGLDCARYINDRELSIYSRYSFEDGYKYYLELDFEEESEKQFGYGLSASGGKVEDSSRAYLVDMYGNMIYGPFDDIGHLMLMPDGTPCFNVRTDYQTIRVIGLDGKYLSFPENLSGTITVMDNGNILVYTREGYKVLDKEYNIIGGPYRSAEYLNGYIYINAQEGEYTTLDEELNEVYYPAELGEWHPLGHDLIIDVESDPYGISSIKAKSISKNETLLDKDDCRIDFTTVNKITYFAISENGVCTLYSYSQKDGLKTLVEDIFAGEEDAVLGKPELLYGFNSELLCERYIYGQLKTTRLGMEAFYGLFIYDTETGEYIIKAGQMLTTMGKYCGEMYWYVMSYGDNLERIMDSKGKLYAPGYQVREIVPDYIGYTIAEKSEDDGKDKRDYYYYKNEKGEEIANNFYSCQPFKADGFTKVSMWYNNEDNTSYVIIDMYGNVVY